MVIDDDLMFLMFLMDTRLALALTSGMRLERQVRRVIEIERENENEEMERRDILMNPFHVRARKVP